LKPRLLLPALALVLAACVGGTSPATQTPADAPTQAPTNAPTQAPTATPAAAPFPVTVDHKYGSTTFNEAPERIVTVGLLEQDSLLALGITPVGTTEWFGEYDGAVWPWAQPYLGDEVPEVVGDAAAVDFEKIIDLEPDAILALYAGLTQEQYDTLSGIAPTVAQPSDYVDYGIPWQELTETVGAIVGKADEARGLVAEVEGEFETARTEHPEFVGATSVVATPYEGIWVYGPEDVRGRLLTALGFVLPDGLVDATGEQYGGNLSEERADLLDVDTIIWLDAADVEDYGGPVYETFAVYQEAREVHLNSFNDPLGGATSFVTVLSLPFLLDGLVPRLEAAIDGDPATAVE